MIESIGNIWTWGAATIIIPTNGIVKSDGSLVMGAGVAKEATQKYPEIAKEWGHLVENYGNNCYLSNNRRLLSFPTKEHWKAPSTIALIEKSAHQVVTIADTHKIESLVMPRVGCGLGGLKWGEVKAVLEDILDDRFVVLSRV